MDKEEQEKIMKLTDKEMEQAKQIKQTKEQLCYQLGFQFLNLIHQSLLHWQNICLSEEQLSNKIVNRLELDGNYNIDWETGEIKPIRS